MKSLCPNNRMAGRKRAPDRKRPGLLFPPAILVLLLLAALCLAGCASGKMGLPPAGFTHWKTLAKKSEGNSPPAVERHVSMPRVGNAGAATPATPSPATFVRPLPTQKVSLKMRNADVRSILRAMALSASVNLLVTDNLKATTSIDFRDVPWDQAFTSLLKSYDLSYVWQGDILRVLTLDDMEQALKAESIERKLEAESPLSTVVVPVTYADAKSLGGELQKLLQGQGKKGASRESVLVNTYSNSLIIHASPDDVRKMLAVIRKVDKPAEQILIRANIVETTQEVARSLGIQWGGVMMTNGFGNNKIWLTPGGSTGVLSSTAATAGPVPGGTTTYNPTSGAAGIGQQGFGVNFPVPQDLTQQQGVGSLGLLYGSLTGDILDMQLQALQTENKAKIVSTPSITTLDNEKAFIESGTRVPYVTYTFAGSSTTPTVNFVNALLKLEITPHVIDRGYLKMSIDVTKDDVDTSHTVQGNPFILKKQTQTTLMVKNGETIVIAGLTSQSITHSQNGVPLLKDIPLLGWLFKGENRDNSLDQVLIFITPYVLPREAAVSAPAKAAPSSTALAAKAAGKSPGAGASAGGHIPPPGNRR